MEEGRRKGGEEGRREGRGVGEKGREGIRKGRREEGRGIGPPTFLPFRCERSGPSSQGEWHSDGGSGSSLEGGGVWRG